MKIGLIFAEQEEIDAVLSKIKVVKENNIYNLNIYECIYNNINCYLVKCGVGKVNAARVAQIIISTYNPDYIINIGVAGSVSKDVNIFDIVIADSLVQHDFDVTLFGRELGFIPNVGKYFKCDEYLIEKAKKINKVHIGVVASGDSFISDEEKSKFINEEFNALCVEMEGASIAQVCFLDNIPFLIIRSISDSPYDKDNHIAFDKFIKDSSEVVSNFLLEILKNI